MLHMPSPTYIYLSESIGFRYLMQPFTETLMLEVALESNHHVFVGIEA